MVAGHAVGLGTGGRRQMQGQPVQRGQDLGRVGQLTRTHLDGRAEGFAHDPDQAPLFGRQPLAQTLGAALQCGQVVGNADARLRVAQAGQDRTFKVARRLRQGGHAHGRQAGAHGQAGDGLAQHSGRLGIGVDQHQRGAGQAHQLFGAFGVAAQPEQVFAGAAADRAVPLQDVVHLQALRQHGKAVHRAVGQHPGVQAGAAALHGQAAVFALRHPGHATGQDVPLALAFGDGIDPHHGGPRCQRALVPDGCAGQAQAGLHRPGVGVFVHRLQAVAAGVRRRSRAATAREGAAQQLVVHLPAHVVPGRVFAAPPRGHGRQGQGLAHQRLRDGRQKALDGGGFQEGAAQRVGHHHMAGTCGLQQTGHAQGAVGSQFQGVAPVVVQPAQHTVYGLQAFHGLQVEMVLAHGEVAPFHQRQAQVARQVGVLEVGLAVGAGRQQHHAGRVAAADQGGALLQCVEQAPVAAANALRPQLAKGVGKLARDHQAVVQHIAQARRPLRALGHQPPAAIRPTRQVKGHHQQALAAGRLRAHHGPQPTRVAQQQGRWQQALVQQRLWPVEVGQHTLEQFSPLFHAHFNGGPVGGLDQLRQQLQRPRP